MSEQHTPHVAYRAVLLAAGLLLFGLLFRQLVTLLLAILITIVVAIPLAAALGAQRGISSEVARGLLGPASDLVNDAHVTRVPRKDGRKRL